MTTLARRICCSKLGILLYAPFLYPKFWGKNSHLFYWGRLSWKCFAVSLSGLATDFDKGKNLFISNSLVFRKWARSGVNISATDALIAQMLKTTSRVAFRFICEYILAGLLRLCCCWQSFLKKKGILINQLELLLHWLFWMYYLSSCFPSYL